MNTADQFSDVSYQFDCPFCSKSLCRASQINQHLTRCRSRHGQSIPGTILERKRQAYSEFRHATKRRKRITTLTASDFKTSSPDGYLELRLRIPKVSDPSNELNPRHQALASPATPTAPVRQPVTPSHTNHLSNYPESLEPHNGASSSLDDAANRTDGLEARNTDILPRATTAVEYYGQATAPQMQERVAPTLLDNYVDGPWQLHSFMSPSRGIAPTLLDNLIDGSGVSLQQSALITDHDNMFL